MADFTTFSVIIPTYSRPQQLRLCLEAIASLQYPRDYFEVLVVDDGSPEPPEDVVREFRNRLSITLLTSDHGGPAAARNVGAARAKNEYLAFTDDDCAPQADWLSALSIRLAAAPGSAVGGRAVNALEENAYSAASQLLLDYLYSHFNVEKHAASFIGAANICVPASHFREIGGFNTSFRFSAEDRDFCDRWLHTGHRMIYAPEVIVYHRHALNLWTFWRQQFIYARGAPRARELQLARGRRGVGPQPISFYLNLLRYPFEKASGGRALFLSFLLAVSQLATLAGFCWEKTTAQFRPVRQSVC